MVQQQNDCPILYRIFPKYSGITLVLTLKEGRLQGIPNYTNLSFASSCSYGKLDNCVFKKKKKPKSSPFIIDIRLLPEIFGSNGGVKFFLWSSIATNATN